MKTHFAWWTGPLFLMTVSVSAQTAARPNILWITCEDTSPDLGCYGDPYARTPNLDRLASQGARFTRAFTVAPVCAPSRSCIITGMYPTTIGTHHMRSKGVPPPYVKCFPEYLRAAGYYCTNNVKTDYNFDPPFTAWDESSNRASWRNRPRPDQPFFSVINLVMTHESQIRTDAAAFAANTKRLRPEDRHDPSQATLPPYYPDTPVVRNDWSRYYDLVTAMDLRVADILKQLDEDGLPDSTIVVFFGDHGRGLPRAKRWVYDSGIHIPLIVRWPGKIAPGTVREDLVSEIDFAPTMLALAGVPVPKHMQGQVFLGDRAAPPRSHIFAARDRMDETYDIIRAVRDTRYKFIRNFQPGKPYAQYIDYMDQMPTLREMRRLNKEGTLVGPQRNFFLPEKPIEELYDTAADPHEVTNLALKPEHRQRVESTRGVLERWMKETGDLGLVPEDELKERMRPGGVMAVTATPTIEVIDGKAQLACSTEGASIGYTTATGNNVRWSLWTGEPIEVGMGTTLRAKACRIGFKDSAEVTSQ